MERTRKLPLTAKIYSRPAWRGQGFVTAPERMQRVHRVIFRTDPSGLWWRTDCKFGSKRRLVLMFEWLTLLPLCGILPQCSHFLAMMSSKKSGNISLRRAEEAVSLHKTPRSGSRFADTGKRCSYAPQKQKASVFSLAKSKNYRSQRFLIIYRLHKKRGQRVRHSG